jgi:hypothetical protein
MSSTNPLVVELNALKESLFHVQEQQVLQMQLIERVLELDSHVFTRVNRSRHCGTQPVCYASAQTNDSFLRDSRHEELLNPRTSDPVHHPFVSAWSLRYSVGATQTSSKMCCSVQTDTVDEEDDASESEITSASNNLVDDDPCLLKTRTLLEYATVPVLQTQSIQTDPIIRQSAVQTEESMLKNDTVDVALDACPPSSEEKEKDYDDHVWRGDEEEDIVDIAEDTEDTLSEEAEGNMETSRVTLATDMNEITDNDPHVNPNSSYQLEVHAQPIHSPEAAPRTDRWQLSRYIHGPMLHVPSDDAVTPTNSSGVGSTSNSSSYNNNNNNCSSNSNSNSKYWKVERSGNFIGVVPHLIGNPIIGHCIQQDPSSGQMTYADEILLIIDLSLPKDDALEEKGQDMHLRLGSVQLTACLDMPETGTTRLGRYDMDYDKITWLDEEEEEEEEDKEHQKQERKSLPLLPGTLALLYRLPTPTGVPKSVATSLHPSLPSPLPLLIQLGGDEEGSLLRLHLSVHFPRPLLPTGQTFQPRQWVFGGREEVLQRFICADDVAVMRRYFYAISYCQKENTWIVYRQDGAVAVFQPQHPSNEAKTVARQLGMWRQKEATMSLTVTAEDRRPVQARIHSSQSLPLCLPVGRHDSRNRTDITMNLFLLWNQTFSALAGLALEITTPTTQVNDYLLFEPR